MLLKRPDPKFSAVSSSENARSIVGFELKRLILLSTAIFLFLSLASYFPKDPSWSTWSSRNDFHNWLGRSGSIIADLLLQLFGVSAFLIALLPAAIAMRMPIRDDVERKSKWIGGAMLVLSLSALVQSFWAARWTPWGLQNPGGVCGSLLTALFGYLAGPVGNRLIAISFLLASLILVFQWQLLTQTVNGIKTLGSLLKEFLLNAPEYLRALPAGLKSLKGKLVFRRKKAEPISPVPSSYAPPPMTANVPALRPATAEAEAVGDGEVELLPSTTFDIEAPFTMTEPPPKPQIKKIPKHRVHRGQKTDFQLPNLSLLSGKAESKSRTVDKSWYVEKANILVQKLKDFGVEGEVVNISPGPVITVYEFKPASGVKIKEISNLSDDLTLALSVLSVRIVAPIPGKPVVGIEIPSPHREMVFFKDLIQETPFFTGEIKIPIALGRLASGEPIAADLASMPHLLIAGSTGTGKSVFINTLICSLLYRFSPEQLKLIMVDPKMVELSHYEGIPHLLLPVVVDSKKAVLALRWAVEEMERRYTMMHQSGVRHVDSYNEKMAELQKKGEPVEVPFLPYIVVVIDEYADLMAVVPKEVELSIARLAQKARASGIHLVLATQRPSTDVVTGTIKANFPSRISFRVASSVDSKTILDRTGADRLLGHGDLLFHSAGFMGVKRMQGPFLSDPDLNRIVEYLKEQGEPEYDERILQQPEENAGGEGGGSIDGDDDAQRLYDLAVRLVTEKGEASISLIQRHLRIGYNRAATLMEQMEKEGVVGQSTGAAKRRSVLVNSI